MSAPSSDTSRRLALLVPDLRGGGAERVSLNLANSFAERGHPVDLVLQRAEGELLPLLRPEVRVIDLAAPRVRSVPQALARYFRRERPAGLLAFMWPLTVAAVAGRALARTPTRLVLTDHSTLSQQYGRPLTRASIRLSARWAYPRAEARTFVSDGSADDFAALTGLPRSSLEVIINPVDLPPLPLVAGPEAVAAWKGTGKRILTVGSLKTEKDHDLLLRAFARLAGEASLAIVGEGACRGALERRAEELGIAERVSFPGFYRDPWSFFASADLFVLSSRFEGLPLVLVEALHAGLPIVSTDCRSGPREILGGGEFGTLVPVGDEDALVAAIESRLAAKFDAERQVERAADYAGAASIRRFEQLLLGSAA